MLATTIHKSNTTPHHQSVRQQHADTPNGMPPPERGTGLLSQSPIVCLAALQVCRAPDPHPLQVRGPSNESPESTADPAIYGAGPGLVVLLRKEVIQPHLPVRLPCYDFVPIADPTFDGSLHKG